MKPTPLEPLVVVVVAEHWFQEDPKTIHVGRFESPDVTTALQIMVALAGREGVRSARIEWPPGFSMQEYIRTILGR